MDAVTGGRLTLDRAAGFTWRALVVLAGVAVRARRASYNCAISASEYPACRSVWLHEGGRPLKLSSTWILCYIIIYIKLVLFE